ncbi:hypothetical protein [Moritella viscosa]|uniref:Uncharacterized protein n=2 Tax=Moritella viscosa TaxID=80854 RepID=A0ABY1HKD5_9GAMM|nr:hypothetical protein [Moritella viscosa]SGZ03537.1 Putative uncharacterized protein [Moritella viscosa]
MLVSERVINGMERRGYSQTKGAALLNDVVVVELRHPFPSTKTLTLKTQESVDLFNKEVSLDSWGIFRKNDHVNSLIN